MGSGRSVCGVAVTALLLQLIWTSAARGQDVAPDPGQEMAPPTTPVVQAPVPEAAPPGRLLGGSAPGAQPTNYCDASGLVVSRNLAFQSEDVAWRLVGLMPGSQVAPRLIDPLAPSSARVTTLGSVLTNSLCEAIGSFSAVDLGPGTYVVSVVGTTSRGTPIELTESLTIVASPRPTPTPRPLPAAPGGVRAAAVNSTTIRLDWSDNSNNETGFRIDSDAGQFRAGANVVTYNVGGLRSNWVYCFSVYAYNDAGESYGGTACAWTPSSR